MPHDSDVVCPQRCHPISEDLGPNELIRKLKVQASLEVKQAELRTQQQFSNGDLQTLTILHFNDVYNIEEQKDEPVAGATRFSTAIKSFSHLNPLVLFSGDALSPSMLSSFTKGEQMSVVLNEFGTQCAVFGNHDFDFGLETLRQRVSETNFPWLMSNIIDNETGRPLGDGKVVHVLNWSDKRIGLIGLVEKEWIDTLDAIKPEDVTFLDFVEVGNKLGALLKEEGCCDYIIALTHMRFPNDIKLAENMTQIDLILGGHDHVYDVKNVKGKYIVKSGTDFRQLSKITINFEGTTTDVKIDEVNVTSKFEEDANLKVKLKKYAALMEDNSTEELAVFTVPLDGRFQVIRTQESNLGNFACDILLATTGADIVLLNAGVFRWDRIHRAGEPFTYGDLVGLLPTGQAFTVLLSITGEQIIAALENGVSGYPANEGRFPHVAGCSFAFDPDKPVGERVDPRLVLIGDEYLVPCRKYSLTTKQWLCTGTDGYTILKDAKLMDKETPELRFAFLQHLQALKLGQAKRPAKHRQILNALSKRYRLVKSLEDGKFDECLEEESWLSPKVQGRIVILNDEIRRKLLLERERTESANVIPAEG